MSHENDEGITVNKFHDDPPETPTDGEQTSAPTETKAETAAVTAPELAAETPVSEGPAPSIEDQEQDILTLQEAVSAAKTPEEKASAQKKVNYAWMKLREEKSALKERLAYFQGKAEAQIATAPAEEAKQDPVLPAVQLPQKPQRHEFLDDDGYQDSDAYEEALVRWGVQCGFAEQAHKAEVDRIRRDQEQAETKQQTWEQEGEKKYPGFREKVQTVIRPLLLKGDRNKAMALSVAVSESIQAHDLTMYLVNNPNEVNRLLGLSPASAAREIGVLETKLTRTQPIRTTAAPEPITPVGGGGKTEDLSNLSDDEYFERQKAKIAQTGRYY